MSDDREMTLGTITVRYLLDAEGETFTAVSLADFNDVPAIIQAGMLTYAMDTLLHPPTEEQ